MKSRICLTGFLMLLVCLTASDLFGQGQRRERDREGGGGRGGRGGMGMMGRGPQSLFALVANPAVQKELDVKEEQNNKLTTVTEDYFTQIRDSVTFNREDFQDADDEKRAKMMAEMQEKRAAADKAATAKLKPELAKILDEKQMIRLQQIYIQSLRGAALENDEVVAALKLSDDQKDKIKTANKENADKLSKLMSSDGDPMDRFAKMRELGDQLNKDLLAVLNEDQTKELDKLKGPEFDLASLRGGRGPGGGGPGGFGGGRRRDEGGPPNAGGRPQRRAESSEKPESDKKSDSDK